MPGAIHSPSSQHKEAAREHELAAYQHRVAAQYHDQQMLHAARLSSEDARECCLAAHRRSMLACGHTADAAVDAGFQKARGGA